MPVLTCELAGYLTENHGIEMITLTCDFCGADIPIPLKGKQKDYRKFQKVVNHKYKDKDLKITLRVESVDKHICTKCGKLAIKSLLK